MRCLDEYGWPVGALATSGGSRSERWRRCLMIRCRGGGAASRALRALSPDHGPAFGWRSDIDSSEFVRRRLSALSTYGKTRVLPPRPAYPERTRTSAPIRRRAERTRHRLLTVNERHLFTPAGGADLLLLSGRFSRFECRCGTPPNLSRGLRGNSSFHALGGRTTREPAERSRAIIPVGVKNSRWLFFRP